MALEYTIIDGVVVPHQVVAIRGEGTSSSLSYLLYGTDSRGAQVRSDIVEYISHNWRRFKPFTMIPSGEPHKTKPEYLLNMSKLDTFGTSS
jgi:hypothetical protein